MRTCLAAAFIAFALPAPAAEPGGAHAMVELALERCMPAILSAEKAETVGLERLGTQFQLVYMRGQAGTAFGAAEPGVALLSYDDAPVCQVLALWADPETMLADLASRLEGSGFRKEQELSGAEGWRTDWVVSRPDGSRVLLMATGVPAPPGPPVPQAMITLFEEPK